MFGVIIKLLTSRIAHGVAVKTLLFYVFILYKKKYIYIHIKIPLRFKIIIISHN